MKDELEQRLGRVREPDESMRQLVVKPVDGSITVNQVRDIAFKNYKIQSVEFMTDTVKYCFICFFSFFCFFFLVYKEQKIILICGASFA